MKKRNRRGKKSIYKDRFEGVKAGNLVSARDPRLPSPAELARSLKNTRITIILDDLILHFFKSEAQRHGVSYQQMIRQVLKRYIDQVQKAA